MRRFWVSTAALSGAVLCGCGSNGGASDGSDTGQDAMPAVDATRPDAATDGAQHDAALPDVGPPDAAVPVTCGAGQPWAPGTPIFREVTAEWGLEALGVAGVRLNVLDYDGDGRPDLLVRNGGGNEDFSPGGVRTKWLLHNTGDGHFEDVTRDSGLLQLRFPGPGKEDVGHDVSVAAAADVDNDGDVDVFLGAPVQAAGGPADQETGELLLNQGDGTFVLGPADSEVRRVSQVAVPAGASFTDIDRDGKIDLWLPQNIAANANQPLQDRLYRGDGAGAFKDITLAAGLGTRDWVNISDLNAGLAHSMAWSSTACDLNGDGIPELMAASYGRGPNALHQGKQSGNRVRYTNRSVSSGYAYDDRMDWTDNESARCYCKLHRDAEDCADVPNPRTVCRNDGDILRWDHANDREPFRRGGNNATTVCADVDNDGDMDLMTTTIVHWDVGSSSDPSELLFNTGESDVKFVRPGNETTGLVREHVVTGWNDGDMTAAVFDFDNDGWPDVYIGSSDYPGDRGLLFHQDPGTPGHFTPVPTSDSFEHNRSHGVVAVDFDHDGDLDLAVGHSLSRCDASEPNNCYATGQIRLFENLMGNTNAWLQLQLEGGAGMNRSAVGARVTVTAGGVTQTQEVDGGHGHFGTQRDLMLHFGLGAACEADVTVRWPDAALTTTTFHVTADHRYQVRPEGAPTAVDE